MAEQYIKQNKRGIVVDTPSGPRAFSGMSKTWHEKVLKVIAETKVFRVGLKHIFLCKDGWKFAECLKPGDILMGENDSSFEVSSITEQPGEFLYDLLDVDGGSAYIADGVIHHNCEFLSSDALLISSLILQKFRFKKPVYEDLGFKFWKRPEELGGFGKTYLISLDPATGSGKDFSVIEVFEFPSLEQVAEWRSNEIKIPLLYAKLKWIINKLSEVVPGHRGRAEVLWTFERNGIGESIATLYMNDEKQPEYAELYSDSDSRYGVYTTGITKLKSCMQLKQLVEKIYHGLNINSETLLYELKNFVSRGNSYEAKAGSTDDCVMATIGVVRLLKRLSEYNEDAFKTVNEYVDADESASTVSDDPFGDEPVPFTVI